MFAFSHSTQEKQKFATQQKQEQGKVGLIILKTDKKSPITNTASE